MQIAKAYKGMGMKGRVARWYGRTTRKDMPEIKALAERIGALIPPAGIILEVAPGPGFLSIELAKRGFCVRAADISDTFVQMARENAKAARVAVQFEHGNAAALLAEDASVDVVVCRAAFKNFAEPVKALAEMRRVLRPGGRALLIDMRRDVSVHELRRYVDRLGVGWLNRQLMMFIFRHMLIKRAYPLESIQRMAADAGWTGLRLEPTPMGFEASIAK
jgi:ubiquinone/menaquinone biosynthesis C-methylase UbiE